MQVCRRFAAEYVAKHLHGLQVFSALPASFTSHHNRNSVKEEDNDNNNNNNSDDHNHHKKVIATHNGMFHCDETMACGLLRHTHNFASADILRTRNM